MSFDYQYPVNNFTQALAVLNPNTDLDIFSHKLYVDLSKVRTNRFNTHIKTQLGIQNDKYIGNENGFVKILLTGHRGSGKSVELRKIAEEIENIYFTIQINIEKELIKLTSVEPEDIYQLIIIKLAEKLVDAGIKFNESLFREIANEWIEDKSFEEAEKNVYKTEVGAEAELGISSLIIKLKTFLKSSITAQSEETIKVHRKIKANINRIISRFNVLLAELGYTLDEHGYKGVIFILDGTEKIYYEVARKLFISDAPIIDQFNAAFIMASPVISMHDIGAGQNYFQNQIFPVVKLNSEEKITEFKKIVSVRVDESIFFEDQILNCIVKKSGGAIRQLLEISYNSLVYSNGNKVTQDILRDCLYEMGLAMYRRLDGEHKELLRNDITDIDFGNKKVQEMLFSLILLVQNGTAVINPLVEPFIKKTENYLCDK